MAELRVHKRRVGVRVQLVDRRCLVGQLYSELCNSDGRPATVADRLNDLREGFLPLAVDGEHHLLCKTSVVAVELGHGELEAPALDGVKEFHVAAALLTGQLYRGRLYAYLPPASARVLDFMNRLTQSFVPLWTERGVVLLNVRYLVEVTENLEEPGQPVSSRAGRAAGPEGAG